MSWRNACFRSPEERRQHSPGQLLILLLLLQSSSPRERELQELQEGQLERAASPVRARPSLSHNITFAHQAQEKVQPGEPCSCNIELLFRAQHHHPAKRRPQCLSFYMSLRREHCCLEFLDSTSIALRKGTEQEGRSQLLYRLNGMPVLPFEEFACLFAQREYVYVMLPCPVSCPPAQFVVMLEEFFFRDIFPENEPVLSFSSETSARRSSIQKHQTREGWEGRLFTLFNIFLVRITMLSLSLIRMAMLLFPFSWH